MKTFFESDLIAKEYINTSFKENKALDIKAKYKLRNSPSIFKDVNRAKGYKKGLEKPMNYTIIKGDNNEYWLVSGRDGRALIDNNIKIEDIVYLEDSKGNKFMWSPEIDTSKKDSYIFSM